MTIKAIAFDNDGVLVPEFVKEFIQEAHTRFQIPTETLRHELRQRLPSLQRGEGTLVVLFAEVAQTMGIKQFEQELHDLWLSMRQQTLVPNKQFLAIKNKLEQKYRLALLTNTHKEFAVMNENVIYSLFDTRVVSCYDGVVKPEQDSYELLAQRLNLPPQEILFIDDRERNLEGARAAGMPVLKYQYGDDLEKTLRSAGVDF